jgi:hypothetical protein
VPVEDIESLFNIDDSLEFMVSYIHSTTYAYTSTSVHVLAIHAPHYSNVMASAYLSLREAARMLCSSAKGQCLPATCQEAGLVPVEDIESLFNINDKLSSW